MNNRTFVDMLRDRAVAERGLTRDLLVQAADCIVRLESMIVTEPEDLDTEAAEAQEETGSGGHVPLRVAEGDDHPTGAPV